MSAAVSSFVYDPDSVLDYSFNWAPWLAENEVITAVEWTVDEAIATGDEKLDGAIATIWLGPGGRAGGRYWVTCRVTTNQGRTDDRSFVLVGRER